MSKKEPKQFLVIESPEMKHVVIGIEKYVKLVKTEPRKGSVKRFDRKITEELQKLKKHLSLRDSHNGFTMSE